MGVIVNKKNNQDKISQRINADLRARAGESTRNVGGADLDLAEDSEYIKNTQKTGKFGWVWIVLIVLAALALVAIVVS